MKLPRLLTRVMLLVACSFLLAPLAKAQYNASLHGTVTDPDGAVVPNATLNLTDKETNRTRTATSGNDGDFSFNGLPPSTYTLDVTREGFAQNKLDNVKIISEQSNKIDIKLTPGGASQTVDVNAQEKPLIDTATGQISGTIDQGQIAKLPSYGRDVFQLVQLAPGVFGDGAQSSGGGTNQQAGNQGPGGSGASQGIFGTENRPQASAAGGRTDQNNVTIDGVSVNSVTWSGAAIVTPNEDSVKELKVVASSYDSEYGRTGAAQIQAISQNGTNQFHGTAFFKADRPGLNAYQRFAYVGFTPQRNASRFNQFGGSIGGPIWHDKIFFFFAYESIRNSSSLTSGGWYETPSIDSAGPSGSIAAKFLGIKGNAPTFTAIREGAGDGHTCSDIGLVQGVSCNFIAGQGLDVGRPLTGFARGATDPSFRPHSSALPNGFPGLGGDGTGRPNNFDGQADLFYLDTVSPFTQVSQQFNGRLDYQATIKDLIAFSIYDVPQTSSSYNGPSRPANFFNHNQTNYAETALWDHTFTPTLINEFRINAAGWKWNEIASNPQTPYGLPTDFINTIDQGTAIGSIGAGGTFNAPPQFGPNVGSIFNQNTYSIKDKVTKVIGAHNVKFGFEGTKLEFLDEATGSAQPSYYFNNLWDFLNDGPTAENATADPSTGIPSSFRKDLRENLFSFFAQDDWKLQPNLTVNLGLRYDHFGALRAKQNTLPNLRLGSGSAVLSGISFQVGAPQNDVPKANFGPQLGFAWSPLRFNNRMVFRGGFGLGYTGLELAITTNTRFDPPFLAQSGTLKGSKIVYGTAPDLYQFGSLPANPNLITTFNSSNLPTAVGQSLNVVGIPQNLKTSYTYRFSLQGQYDLGSHWVATLGYQGSLGRQLPLQSNLNAVYASSVLAKQVTFNPQLNYIGWFENTGSSNFNALLAEIHHQFASTFELDTQYRWSKSLDNGSGPYITPDYIFTPGYNYGPSDFDVRHMLKIWGLWSPRFFPADHGLLEKLVGGFTLSAIVNLHTGYPWNPNYGGLGCNAVIPNSGDCNLRPARYLGGAGSDQSTNTFVQSNGNFPNATSSAGASGRYFLPPKVVNNNQQWNTNGSAVTPTALPDLPGTSRNAFRGPRYFDTDATLTKAFGLPRIPGLGENARLEIRANAYNLFNQLNLISPQANITDSHFGRATNVLGSRTIELEAHFRF